MNSSHSEPSHDSDKQYDRQIRLWGHEAQQRLVQAHVLLVGLRGLLSEVCKNLVLAGMGVTLMDDGTIVEEDLTSGFFFHEHDVGRHRATVMAEGARCLNPLVRVDVVVASVHDQPVSFFRSFSVVCVADQAWETMVHVNHRCHTAGCTFYGALSCGFLGFFFVDAIQDEEDGRILRRLSLKSALGGSLECPSRRTPRLLYGISGLYRFEQETRRRPQSSREDIQMLQKHIDEARHNKRDDNDDEFTRQLITGMGRDVPPCCAVVGGMLAQEIVRRVSRNEPQVNTLFFFDGFEGSGIVFDP